MSQNDTYSINDIVNDSHDLKIERIYKPFDASKKAQIMNDIQESDLIIFLTHGTEEEILRYRNNPDKNLDYVLVDKTNVCVFKNKVVLAFCCSGEKRWGE